MTISAAVNAALLLIAGVVSFYVIPPLAGWLTARNAEGWVKQLVVSVLALLEAVVAVWLAGELNLTNFAATLLTIAVAAQFSYKTVTKDLAEKAHDSGPQLGAPENASTTSSSS